ADTRRPGPPQGVADPRRARTQPHRGRPLRSGRVARAAHRRTTVTAAATRDAATKRLTLDHSTEYDLIAREPKLVVEPNERFVVETEAALAGAIHDESQPPTAEVFGDRLAREEFNPCSGPVIVTGAHPGDVLAVHIHEIVVAPQGVTCVFEGV